MAKNIVDLTELNVFMRLRYFLVIFFLFSCKKSSEDKIIAKNENHVGVSAKENTLDFATYKKNLGKKSNEEKKQYWFTYINYDVPKYWIGTPWSFNGTTKIPQEGSIACGYFVTHILMDYGFDINGTQLAQKPSSVMIKQLCKGIKHFGNTKELENYLLSNPKNQVYLVGLDFHTGFITRENQDIYFIHSNYIKNKGVTKEKIHESQALNASKTFMIGILHY